MRQVQAPADPDSPPRLITLPASWDDAAAEALAVLAPGEGAVSLAAASAIWLGVIGQRARQEGVSTDIVLALHGLLRRRQAAPTLAVWRGAGEVPGFILNWGAFHDPLHGFDVELYTDACRQVARACRLLAPDAPAYEIGGAGLDDLLAALGLDYASRAARATAACLAAVLRAETAIGPPRPPAARSPASPNTRPPPAPGCI
jgi:hypothetical protein